MMRRAAVLVLAALAAFWLSVEDGFAQKVIGRHPGAVASLALSPDGKTLASGGNGGTIQLWDYSTGTPIRTLDGNISEVDWMRFWPGSRYLLNSSFYRLQAHDLKTGERLPISDQLGICYYVALSPDRRTLAVSDEYSVVSVWDFLSGERKGELENVDVHLDSLVYSHDGLLIAGSWEDGIYIWNAETLRVKHQISIPGRMLGSLTFPSGYRIAFLPDNLSIARARFKNKYGDGTGTAEVWDLETGMMRSSFGGDFSQAAFSPDGRKLLSVNGSQIVTLWELETGRILRAKRRLSNTYDRPYFSEDSSKLIVGFDSNEGQIWDAETGRIVSTFHGSLYQTALSPDGRTAASSTTFDGYHSTKTRVWDIETGEMKGEAPANNTPIASVSLSPDGRSVVSSPRRVWSGDSSLRIWDLLTGQEKANYWIYGEQAAFSPDGQSVAALVSNEAIQIRNVETGELTAELPEYRSSLFTFSPDGRSIAFINPNSQRKGVYIWRIDLGRVSAELKGDQRGASLLAYSPDGSMLAVGRYDAAFLWNSESGDLIRTFADGTNVEALAFSPDSKTLLTGGEDSVARLWDVSSGALRAELKGHEGAVGSAAYSPDGALIAVAGGDGAIRIWSAETFQLKRTLRGHAGYVSSVAFSPDSRSLVSGGKDGRVLLWRFDDLPILWSDAKRPNSPLILKNALLPNYPNPFNPETWIPFDLAQESSVTIAIYNSAGQTVRRMELGELPAGSYRAKGKAAYWDGKDALGAPAASGVYFVRIEAGSFSETRRMVLLK
ncbi:MAG: T9SS type A sorting domain-containing protein [Candidatus Poribacteria bacterium]|nr:T9SS type A sorting domain-containing protein [Candidatus Poribacteria bacterium]